MRPQRTHWPVHSPDHDAFGRGVREVRARRAISQETLGFRSALHRNYVGAIERGEINFTFATLLNLRHGLAVPLPELVAIYERNMRERRA